MFDEYLDRQHELGAAEDNFAKLQYRAAVAMKRHKVYHHTHDVINVRWLRHTWSIDVQYTHRTIAKV